MHRKPMYINSKNFFVPCKSTFRTFTNLKIDFILQLSNYLLDGKVPVILRMQVKEKEAIALTLQKQLADDRLLSLTQQAVWINNVMQ